MSNKTINYEILWKKLKMHMLQQSNKIRGQTMGFDGSFEESVLDLMLQMEKEK